MSDNYTWGRVGPNSANPEIAVNDALENADNTVKGIEVRLATIEDTEGGGLPDGGAVGQILAVQTAGANRVLAWIDPPVSGGEGGGGSADYPANPVVGKVLKVKSIDPLVVEWATDNTGSGGGASYPDGGAVGQVLKIKSLAPLVVYWAADIVGEGGSGGGGVIEVTFPRAASLTDKSVYGRGSSAAPLTMTDTEKGATFQDRTSDTQGFKTVLKPLPAAPTADAPFEVGGKIIYAAASAAQYNIQGFVFVDAAGNTQIWGLNGSNSGREGNGNASYVNGGNWQDGDYTIGNPGQGSYFRMVCDGATFKMYRSQDGVDWGNPLVNYAVSSGRVGIPTRYGFLTHRYSGGLGDLVTVTDAYSTEFPKGVAAPVSGRFGKHKYWRVYCPAGSGFNEWSFAGIGFFDEKDAAIPTLHNTNGYAFAPPTADPGPSRMFDGDPATYSGDAPYGSTSNSGAMVLSTWFGFAFNDAVSVEAVSITARNDDADAVNRKAPTLALLQYSDDDKSYTTAYSFGGPTFTKGETRKYKPNPVASGGGGGGGSAGVTPVAARSWRLYIPAGTLDYFAACISTIQFLDKNGAVIPTTGGASFSSDGSANGDNAFDSDPATFWQERRNGDVNGLIGYFTYVGYRFPTAVQVYGVKVTARPDGAGSEKQVPTAFKIQGLDDATGKFQNIIDAACNTFALNETKTWTV